MQKLKWKHYYNTIGEFKKESLEGIFVEVWYKILKLWKINKYNYIK